MSTTRDIGLVLTGAIAGAAGAILAMETYLRKKNELALTEAMDSLIRVNEQLNAQRPTEPVQTIPDEVLVQETPEGTLSMPAGEVYEPVESKSAGVVMSKVEQQEQSTPYHRMAEAIEQQKVEKVDVFGTGDEMVEEITQDMFYRDDSIAGKIVAQVFIDGAVPIVVFNGEENQNWQEFLPVECVQRIINKSRGDKDATLWYRNHRLNTDFEVAVANP